MVNGKIIVWDLFGGSQHSVKNALKDNLDKYEIYTFDINFISKDSKYDFYLDLSTDWHKLLDILLKFPKPDIIVASPMCQSFSLILNCGKGERLGWKYCFDRYIIRPVSEIEILKNKSNFLKQNKTNLIFERAVLGKKLLENTLKIISYFHPKVWYIENPQTSLMWKVIDINYYQWVSDMRYFYSPCFNNDTYYYCYSKDFSRKPTRFLSNVYLNLKKFIVPQSELNFIKRKNGTRSKVNIYNMSSGKDGETGPCVLIPKELIQDIFNKFETYFK